MGLLGRVADLEDLGREATDGGGHIAATEVMIVATWPTVPAAASTAAWMVSLLISASLRRSTWSREGRAGVSVMPSV